MATRAANPGLNTGTQARIEVSGTVTRVFDFVDTATLSNGDVVEMRWARIPHGAVITDVKMGGMLLNGSATVIPEIVVGSTATMLGGSLTLSAAGVFRAPTAPTTANTSTNIPFVVSVSDDAEIRYAWLRFTVQGATSATTSGSIVYAVTYTMDK